jgi:hypothetical protein
MSLPKWNVVTSKRTLHISAETKQKAYNKAWGQVDKGEEILFVIPQEGLAIQTNSK